MRLIQHQMSQLLIVDIQDKVLELIENAAEITAKAQLLADSTKLLQIPAAATLQDPGRLGLISEPVRTSLDSGANIFEKRQFSALRNEDLCDFLDANRDHGRGQIVLAGVEAHIAVTQTALHLINEGFEVYVVADAIGSRAPASYDLALRRLERSGAFLVDVEMVLSEWLEQSGTAEYNVLSARMK